MLIVHTHMFNFLSIQYAYHLARITASVYQYVYILEHLYSSVRGPRSIGLCMGMVGTYSSKTRKAEAKIYNTFIPAKRSVTRGM